MFARRRSSSYRQLNKITTTRFNIVLVACFLFVAIENVTSMSLEHLPQQQQQNDKKLEYSEMMLPEAESVVFDNDMEVTPVAVDGNSDMYLLVPASSQQEEDNVLQSLSEQDESMKPFNAEGMSDMLMMESEDTPAMQILEIPDEVIEHKIEEAIEAQEGKESSNQVSQMSAEETEQPGNIATDVSEAVVDMMAEAVQEIEKEIDTELIGNEEDQKIEKEEQLPIENQKEEKISNNELSMEHKDTEMENTEAIEQEQISQMEIKPEEIFANPDAVQEEMIGVVMEEANETPVSDVEETEKIQENNSMDSKVEESELTPVVELMETESINPDVQEEQSQMTAELIGNEEVEKEELQIENQKDEKISNNELAMDHKDTEMENTENMEQQNISQMEIKPEEISVSPDADQEEMIGVVMEESNEIPVSDAKETEKDQMNSNAEESELKPTLELMENESENKQDVEEEQSQMAAELFGNEEVEKIKKEEQLQIENQKEEPISNNELPMDHKETEMENTEAIEQEKISQMEIKSQEISVNPYADQEEMIDVVMEESNETPISDVEETEKNQEHNQMDSNDEESELTPVLELMENESENKQDVEEEQSQTTAELFGNEEVEKIKKEEQLQVENQKEEPILNNELSMEHKDTAMENTEAIEQEKIFQMEIKPEEISVSPDTDQEEIIGVVMEESNETPVSEVEETEKIQEHNQIDSNVEESELTPVVELMEIDSANKQEEEQSQMVAESQVLQDDQLVEETQGNENQTVDESQTVDETQSVVESQSAEVAQVDELAQNTIEESEKIVEQQAAAETFNNEADDQTNEESQVVEELTPLNESQTVEEPQIAETIQEAEKTQTEQNMMSEEAENQIVEEIPVAVEIQAPIVEETQTKDYESSLAEQSQTDEVTEIQEPATTVSAEIDEAAITAENQESFITEEKPAEILVDETSAQAAHKDGEIQPVSLVDEEILQNIETVEEIKKVDEPVVDDNILEDDTNEDTSSMLTTIIPVPIQEEQHHEPQQPAMETVTTFSTTTLKPLNVMDSVLNYVNASLMNQMNNDDNAQDLKDEQTDLSSKLRRYDGAQVWRIVVQNDREKKLAEELQTKYDGQLWKEVKQEVDYLLKPQVLAEAERYVKSANLPRIVLIDNLQKVIEVENPPAEEIAQLQNRKGHRLTWQAYHRLEDIHGYLDYLAKTYPDICSIETIGYSIEKRPLKILKISNGNANNPGIWIDGGMHAREWISPAVVTFVTNQIVEGWDELPAYMRNINWYIHAVANPDGYEYSHTTDRLWRKNRRPHGRVCPGVDLNRNFGYKWGGKDTSANPCAQTYRGSKAFSEPEAFYISKFISNFPRETFKAYLSFHSYGQYILYPWGYDYHVTKDMTDLDLVARRAGTIITKSTGVKYTVGPAANTLYPASGGSDDWAKGIAGIKYSYTIEMGDTGRYGFVLPAAHIEPNGQNGFTFVETVAKAIKMGKNSRRRKLKAKSH